MSLVTIKYIYTTVHKFGNDNSDFLVSYKKLSISMKKNHTELFENLF